MFAGLKAVIHIEICAASEKLRTATCSRHMANLCVLRLLSPKGRRGGGGGGGAWGPCPDPSHTLLQVLVCMTGKP